MIEAHVVKSAHKKVAKDLHAASQCFRNECSLLNHEDRDTLLQRYHEGRDDSSLELQENLPEDPDDDLLVEILDDTLPYLDDEEAHQTNRSRWPLIIHGIFSPSNRQMFQRRFGLDIWFSFVSLPNDGRFSEEYGFPQATIAYLTLPNSVKRQQRWCGNIREEQNGDVFHEYRSLLGENGFGMPVNISRQPSAEELQRFSQALRFLKLEIFVHESQKHDTALDLGAPVQHSTLDASQSSKNPGSSPESEIEMEDSDGSERTVGSAEKDDLSGSPFPCLTLLTRNKH